MMKKPNDFKSLRGVSNSPLTSTKDGFDLDKVITGKEVKIDWYQVTFDFIPVSKNEKFYYDLDLKSPLFKLLLDIFKRPEKPQELEKMPKGQFGYLHGIYIDEFIWLSYGGKENKRGKYPMTLTMSGQGCRAFEIMGGNWIELFQYFQLYGGNDLKVGRIDIAIDDFEGDVITPYQILPYIEKNHCVTQFRTVTLHKSWTLGEDSETQGFTITLGQRGSNQLQIYDKRLERDQMDQPDLNTPVWYRYEMRFVEEKARQVMDMYTASVVYDNSKSFMKYAKQLLLTCLELKQFNPDDSNKTRWNILPAWKKFTNSLLKVDLKSKNRIDTTIEKKVKWFKDDMSTTLLELYYVYESEFGNEMFTHMGESNFTRKHLNKINAFLRKLGKPEKTLQDIKKDQEIFKKYYQAQKDPEVEKLLKLAEEEND